MKNNTILTIVLMIILLLIFIISTIYIDYFFKLENKWTSLDIVKIMISLLTPLLAAYIAFEFSKLNKKVDKIEWINQKVVDKRIQVYEMIVPKLNDLLCFYCYIGNWKDLSPEDIIKIKRSLDKEVHIYAPLFSERLISAYDEFNLLCFETFTNWGKDAKIKALYKNRKKYYSKKWNDDWDKYFSDGYKVTEIYNIQKSYMKIMKILKQDIIIYNSGKYITSNIPLTNIK